MPFIQKQQAQQQSCAMRISGSLEKISKASQMEIGDKGGIGGKVSGF